MKSPEEILQHYWKHPSFRSPQKEIIDAVLGKKDVTVLLPTGGGKSICFQVPALVKEGICLVISPLIALMQDQVASLQKKGIKATTIASGTKENDLITLFDNIKFGNYKFLYISPERLQSVFIQQKLKELNISFVAIDEAHCISEWGHDFRPAYRNIKVLKEILKGVNFIALTATANERVLDDISQNLELNKPVLFKKSFYRDKLAYQIFTTENKLLKLQQIFTKTKSPAIVYVSTRKKTKEISDFLNSNHFNSTFYHGGLSPFEKKTAFDNWMNESKKIIVTTNAFGMGIDKPNVGIVIHFDAPFSFENYIQESGRAGRNQKKSFAVLLKNEHDIYLLKSQLKKTLPTILEVKEVHKKLYQYFRIAYGEISEESYQFSLYDFCNKYEFSQKKVEIILKILANNSIIEITNTYNQKSTVIFNISSKNVISYAISNIYIKNFINSLLRTYTGLFKQKVKIDEYLLAKKNSTTTKQIYNLLNQLNEDGVVDYNRIKTENEIRFLVPREDNITINKISKNIQLFIKQKQEKLYQFLAYIQNNKICRSIQILTYFDENSTQKCGICDVCLSEKRTKKTAKENDILQLLAEKRSLSSQEINQHLKGKKKHILILLQHLLLENKIVINHQNKYQLK
ncbi:RecQ family ATP-dependent DNA helicase [Polaribacter porphyrae]|uniref:ATP-dependent DNA helicase RecQ n=1 Tax=Polaribacter porphyrae TaxID=1137780 RepID=A0A2S7WNA9_9FLAO|nr:ATP-dependent DNA helicase RecQ [Polaribacter porphyrae]PQJ78751.1 DEAD/DEAH box helicase [Polaribacter porphyrae]